MQPCGSSYVVVMVLVMILEQRRPSRRRPPSLSLRGFVAVRGDNSIFRKRRLSRQQDRWFGGGW